MPPRLRLFITLLFFVCLCTRALGQSAPLSKVLLNITSRSDSINSRRPAEKIVMQLDKPYFTANDTLWFKAYIFNNNYLTPSAKSGFLYVDVASKSGVLIKQLRFPVTFGLSWGNIQLSDKDFKPGAYLLRAYTTWMRNFGEENFLYTSIAVLDSTGKVPPPLMYKSAKTQAIRATVNDKLTNGLTLTTKVAGDSVELHLDATNNNPQKKENYFLVANARGVVCYAAVVSLSVSRFQRKLPASIFPSGTVYFNLLDTLGKVLLTSTLAVQHPQGLKIKISPKDVYGQRDSVALQLQVTNNGGVPLTGNFSISVTDDAQVKIGDEIKQGEIAGTVSNTTGDEGNIKTHPIGPEFPAETEFIISGEVVNVFGKHVKRATVTLLSRKPAVLSEASTGTDGRFVFKNIPLSDTAIFVLQAKNKRGHMFNVGIRVDEAMPPALDKASIFQTIKAKSQPADSMAANMAMKQADYKKRIEEPAEIGHRLKEVKVTAKKIVKGSENWNGGGNADFVIDEKELEKSGKKSFLDLLYEQIPGFREGTMVTGKFWPDEVIAFDAFIKGTPEPSQWYFIKDKVAMLYVDGIEVRGFVQPFLFDDYKKYLQSCTAEDIKGIEVNVSSKYAGAYLQHWLTPLREIPFRDFAFIEITTRSGSGPMIQHGIGNYLYKPQALTYPVAFHSPKYTAKKSSKDAPDVRSTLFWSPNVFTDKNGLATISFYSGDGPATYTVTIAGTDMNGNIGSATCKLKVK